MSVVYKGGHIVGKSGSVFATSSGGGSVPTNVQVVLQGQDTPNNGGAPPQPNHMWIGWNYTGPTASTFNIYRQSNPTGSSPSGYSYYDTITPTNAASTYATYVAAGIADGYQTGDSDPGTPYANYLTYAYQDTGATDCLGYPVGTVTSYNEGELYNNLPSPGYDPIGYQYKVTAVVGGNESSQSSDSIWPYFMGGCTIGCAANFSGMNIMGWADTGCPSASPLGFSTNAKWGGAVASLYISPFTGNCANNENLNFKGLNYFVISLYTNSTAFDLTFGPEMTGDLTMAPGGGSYDMSSYFPGGFGSYLPANQWITLKVPIADLYEMQNSAYYGSYPDAQQYAFYKATLESQPLNSTAYYAWIEWYWSVN